jgi:uncharacterized protein YcbK (DUF882 family)
MSGEFVGTKNFKPNEMNSRVSGQVPEHLCDNAQELLENLQILRDELNAPITIISGWRSKLHNDQVGGAKNSQHLYARAADVKVKGMHPVDVYNKILELIKTGKMKKGGVGLYGSWVHYDTRGRLTTWKS